MSDRTQNYITTFSKLTNYSLMDFIHKVKRGEDKTWTRGPWTPTLDRVHGPLSWTGSMDPLSWTGSMDSFFKIMRNEQKQK